MGAVWELPAKQHSQSSSFQLKVGWIGCAIQQVTSNGTHDFFQIFRIYFFNYFIKNPQTTIALTFLTHIISAIGGVQKLSFQRVSIYHKISISPTDENYKCNLEMVPMQFAVFTHKINTIPNIFNRKNLWICCSKNLIKIRNGVKETTFRFGLDQEIFQYLSMLKACIDLPVGKNKNCLIHQL